MSRTILQFVVPTTYHAVADEAVQHFGTVTGLPGGAMEDREALVAFLASRVGSLVEIEFDDDFGFHDNPVLAMAKELDRHDTSYFGYYPPHEERSRRERFDGGYIVRFQGTVSPVARSLPWAKGDPTPFDEDMRAAGFDDAQIARISETFFPASTRPTP